MRVDDCVDIAGPDRTQKYRFDTPVGSDQHRVREPVNEVRLSDAATRIVDDRLASSMIVRECPGSFGPVLMQHRENRQTRRAATFADEMAQLRLLVSTTVHHVAKKFTKTHDTRY